MCTLKCFQDTIIYLERESQFSRPQSRVALLLWVVEDELLVRLLPVDVPREVGRGEAVSAGAGHVHAVANVIAGVTAQNVGAALGEG